MTDSATSPSDELAVRTLRISGIPVEVLAPASDVYFQGISATPDKFEPAVSVAALVLPTNGVVLDLGACLGTVSAAVASLVPHGRVIAVEPSHSVIEGLRATCERAPGGPIEVVHAGVGATSGTLSYNANPEGAAWGYLAEHGDYEVPVTTVDELVTAQALERVDLVKIDVEGFELPALEGAAATIARFHPVLVLELNPYCLWRFGRTMPQDVLAWITERFPFVWAVDDDGVATPVRSDADADRVLGKLGATGGLTDIVAAFSPIDFPESLNPRPQPTSTPAPAPEPEPAAPTSALRRWYEKLPTPVRLVASKAVRTERFGIRRRLGY